MELDYLILTNIFAKHKKDYQKAIDNVIDSLNGTRDLTSDYLNLVVKFLEKYLDTTISYYTCPGSGDSYRNFKIRLLNGKIIIKWVGPISCSDDSLITPESCDHLREIIEKGFKEFNLTYYIEYEVHKVRSLSNNYRVYF